MKESAASSPSRRRGIGTVLAIVTAVVLSALLLVDDLHRSSSSSMVPSVIMEGPRGISSALQQQKQRGFIRSGLSLFSKNDNDDKFQTAGDFTSIAGFWLGAIEQWDLRILFRITSDGKVLNYSLDQFGMPIPAGNTHFDEYKGVGVFWFPTINGMYRASVQKDPHTGETMFAGEWKQNGITVPLNLIQSTKPVVPREYEYLARKFISGCPKKLQRMVGYWSGYSLDGPDDDAPELNVVHIEKITDKLVEAKFYIPAESELPMPLWSFQVSDDGKVKIILDYLSPDDHIEGTFVGDLSADGKKMTGKIYYDDQHYTPPLELVWSKDFPPGRRL